MKKLILLLPIALSVLLTGCTSIPIVDKETERQAKTFTPQKEISTIYIYRKVFLEVNDFHLEVNGVEVNELTSGYFFKLDVPSGHQLISLWQNQPWGKSYSNHFKLDTEAEKNYFFEISRSISGQVEPQRGKVGVLPLSMVFVPDNVAKSIAAATQRSPVVTNFSNLPPASKLTAPMPISGNSGNYMSPFTATGGIAPWAVEVEATTDNGSDLAANVGGAVGEQVGRKALDFIPFGLGGMVGKEVGSQAGRSATRTTTQARVPSAEEAKATSDISFNTPNELAVFMYAKYSSHPEYARVLSLTQQVYPELTRVYVLAIEQAAKSPEKVAQGSSKTELKKTELKDKLEALKELKDKGLISESDYQVKKNKLIDAM